MCGVSGRQTVQPDGLVPGTTMSHRILLSSRVFSCSPLSSSQYLCENMSIQLFSPILQSYYVSSQSVMFISALQRQEFRLPSIRVHIVNIVKLYIVIIQGSYSDQPGGDAVQHCRPCEAGWFCSRAGLSGPQGLCDPGHYCTSGASTASPVRCNT